MEQSSFDKLLHEYMAHLGISLTSDQLNQFWEYKNQLQIWSKTANLTTITDDHEILVKHFVDSLAGLRAENMKHGASLLDVGTGAGFPGIPLKIVRPDLALTLLDPVHKKVSFLRFIVGRLRLQNSNIFCGTLQKFTEIKEHLASFDYVTTRALKYSVVLSGAQCIVSQKGRCILYLSEPVEYSNCERVWKILESYSFGLPNGYGARVVSVLERRDT